jgi:hypothetical protein
VPAFSFYSSLIYALSEIGITTLQRGEVSTSLMGMFTKAEYTSYYDISASDKEKKVYHFGEKTF